MDLSQDRLRNEVTRTAQRSTPLQCRKYKTRQLCLKNQVADSGRFKLNCITLNYKAPRRHGQVGKPQLIRAAVYFGRFSTHSLNLLHIPNVTSEDN